MVKRRKPRKTTKREVLRSDIMYDLEGSIDDAIAYCDRL
jgi:hypothetical protein